MNLSNIVSSLKRPLHTTTFWLLGDCDFKEADSKVKKVTLVIFRSALMVIYSLIWCIAEGIESVSTKYKRRFCEIRPEWVDTMQQTKLEGGSSLLLGTSTSTFQTSSDPGFCEGGAICSFLNSKQIKTDRGVDILTAEGRQLTLENLLRLNANTFRFSIEWMDATKNGLDHYTATARFFHENNIKVILTLDHWIGDGKVRTFEEDHNIDAFAEFCKKVYIQTFPYVTAYITFNEPAVDAAQKYVLGALPPNQIARFWNHHHLLKNKIKAHKKIYQQIRLEELNQNYPQKPIGISHQALTMLPENRTNYLARVTAFVFNYVFHESFFHLLKSENALDAVDFIGLQYYSRPVVGRSGLKLVTSKAPKTALYPNPYLLKNMQYRYDPYGIHSAIHDVYSRTKKPLLITETGICGKIERPLQTDSRVSLSNPEERKKTYYEKSLKAISQAQHEKAPVLGVLFWTLFDNIEWQHGYDPECMFGILGYHPEKKQVIATEGFETIKSVFSRSLV